MSISVECPACEHEFHIPNSYGGKKGKCPECGKIFSAPAASSASPPPTSRIQSPQPPRDDNGRIAPVPPPEPFVARTNTMAVSEPPAVAVDGAPPISEAPVVASPPIQSPRPEKKVGLGEASPRRSKNTALWAAVGVLSAMLLICAIVMVKSMRLEGKELVGDDEDKKQQQDTKPKTNPDKVASKSPIVEPPAKVDIKDLQLDQMLANIRPAVFRLTVESGDTITSGLAFAIDERGWLATSYHLIKDAKFVDVSALMDSETESLMYAKGIVASSPEHDVAIIAVEQKPGAILSLDVTPPEIEQELAICRSGFADQLEMTKGAFARVTSFDRLTPNSRAVAQQQGLDRSASLFWLEHDQPLEPDDRGGPLLNADGKVIGMNASLSPNSKTGFALPAAYLTQLVESASDQITPFANVPIVVATNDKTPVDPGKVGPGDVPKPPARPEPGSLESIDVLRELHEICKDIEWKPESIEEYGLVQELAEYVYVAKANETDVNIEEGLRILIAAPAQDVLVDLSRIQWQEDEAARMKLNALAVQGLNEKGKGIFCYVEIDTAPGDSVSIDGSPVILCNLVGTEQSVAVPVKKESKLLKKKTRWLLVGMDSTETVKLRGDDGMEVALPVIRAKHLLGEPNTKRPAKTPARRGRR
jgi:S1-C subfamily serine protease